KDKFEIPSEETTGWRGEEAYVNLGEDGLIAPETYVRDGDVLIGGSAPPKFLEEISEFGIIEEKRREKSMENKAGSDGHVDSVILSESDSGTIAAKIKIRCEQIPEIGDKFSSMHYQKGVLGAIIPEYDIPFTRDGIKPDVIINPAAIPTRMIMGQVVEALAGKAACLDAKEYDGTAFTKVDNEDIRKVLLDSGYRSDGKEVMYDGITGEKIEAEIFIGVGYYRRLTHIVSTIIQARGKGRVQMLTRQPTEGKARQGGLKFEEMQRDCLIGYGAAMLLQDRLLYNADRTMFPVCEKCGLIARTDNTKSKAYCPSCKGGDISEIAMPYAFKLAIDEMMSMHIYPKLKIKDMV
ncbi:MAG: DNA-directed RNA polymerase subunit B, partial [Candidatus Diapherotrites archaeon]|nr:DNA-directed RNA polymerase subunit B [Candidatus Diapherotrites archaeon]